MKIRLTIEVDDQILRAFAAQVGRDGRATRDEVKSRIEAAFDNEKRAALDDYEPKAEVKVLRFPSIGAVAQQLRNVNREVEVEVTDRVSDDEGCDVRLQVYEDGAWAIRYGDAQYDQDHRGYWGSASVPGNNRRFRSEEVARDLIEQAKDQYAEDPKEA
jgi:hypothetical protein